MKADKPSEVGAENVAGSVYGMDIICLPDQRGHLDPQWLSGLRQQFPEAAFSTLARLSKDAGLSACHGLAIHHSEWLQHLIQQITKPTLVIRSGLSLPPYLSERLSMLHECVDGRRIIVFPGNYSEYLNPLTGLASPESEGPTADAIDSLMWNFSECTFAEIEPDLAQEVGLAWLLPNAPHAQASGHKTVVELCDLGFIYDPEQELYPQSTLSPLVTRVVGGFRQMLSGLESDSLESLGYPGLDGQPVTLHISHDWGGGISRWIKDLVETDPSAHHLVLCAKADQGSALYGHRLGLYGKGPGKMPLHEYVLEPVISDTTSAHDGYQHFLKWVIERYGVGRIMVSSLIGHSLDCLCQDLPTAQVLHDFYPASPVLDCDPLTYQDQNGAINLSAAISDYRATFKFPHSDASYWTELRDAWLSVIRANNVRLIAPSQHVAKRWAALFSDPLPETTIISHGFVRPSSWEQTPKLDRPALIAHEPLRLVVMGRLSSGKGLNRLMEAANILGDQVQWTVLGGGNDAMYLFGHSNIDVILDYEMAELPKLLQDIDAHAAVFLSRVPETWNYVLSEVWSLGLLPIAPDLGSFSERITHGQDGFLYPPSAEGLCELLTRLLSGSDLWPAQWSQPDEPSMASRIEAYNEAVPYKDVRIKCHRPPNQPIGYLHLEQEQKQRQIKATNKASDEVKQLHLKITEQAGWLERLDRTLKTRTQWALRLEEELVAYESIDGQLGGLNRDDDIHKLRQETEALKARLQQAEHQMSVLDQQLSEVTRSRSWKFTRPMRVATRILRTLHQRKVWLPNNWPRQVKRLFHSIRVHGWRTTLEALQHPRFGHPGPTPDLGVITQPDPKHIGAPVEFVRLLEITQPNISIIIPVHNNLAYTAHCLNSIAEHDDGSAFEIVVVDDCSTDDTHDYLQRCQGVRVIRNEQNLGFIGSCNAGATHAQGEFLVFLNNDTQVTKGWLEALLLPFYSQGNVGIVGAKLVYPDGTLQEAGGIVFKDGSGWNYGRGGAPDAPSVQFLSEADYVSGACLAIARERFLDLGGFDSNYAPAYYEDTDLCLKVWQQGLRVLYQPMCTIIHFEGVSNGTSESSGIKKYQAVNRSKFQKRWSSVLALHPAPVPGPGAHALIEQARHHRAKGHIVVVDAVTPQPDHDSGSVRMLTILELLLEMGYRVTFVPSNLAWDGQYSQALRDRGIETLNHPNIASIKQWLQANGSLIDWVMGSRYYVLDDVLGSIRASCPKAKIIFDTVDLHFLREQRRAVLEENVDMARAAAKTEQRELSLIEQSDVTLVVSPIEQALLENKRPQANIQILSNIHTPLDSVPPFTERNGILFVGGFQHPPNVDAAKWLIEEILPALLNEDPSIELHLIGSRMPEWLKSARASGLRNHGFVHDLTPYLASARVAVAPLRYGAGVKGKVNQAMAYGLPVVASPAAAEGIYATPEEDILIGETTQDFVHQILRAHSDMVLWERLSINGRKNVEAHFSRQTARERLEIILSGARGA
jgi:GT2 family glycosyltransferase/glycosyltransferase involved in cell wall biosynthesis